MMKKNLLFAASILAISGFLAACGTEDSTGSEPSEDLGAAPGEMAEDVVEEETDEETPAEDTGEETAPEDEAADETDGSEDETESGSGESDSAEDTEGSADETSPNRAEAEGTLTESDEQAYEMYVLPGYELTSEEPGRDSLYSSEDGNVFMRVETFDSATLDFAGAQDGLTQTLQAINSDAELTEGTIEDANFSSSATYEVPADSGKVTGVVLEKDNMVIRLTIFDTVNLDVTDDFIEMGKTIQATEA